MICNIDEKKYIFQNDRVKDLLGAEEDLFDVRVKRLTVNEEGEQGQGSIDVTL